MARVGQARFEITAHDRSAAAMASAKRNLQGLGSTARMVSGQIGALIGVAGLGGLIRETVRTGSAITDMAASANIGIEQLQVLTHHARLAGASNEQLTQALVRVQKAVVDAEAGLRTANRSFERLGLHYEDLIRLTPERQLEAVAKAMVNAEDQAIAYGAALDLIGTRNAPQLNEMLQKLGYEGFDALTLSAIASGTIMSESTAKAMDDLADRASETFARLKVITAQAISYFLDFGTILGVVVADIMNKFQGLETQWAEVADMLINVSSNAGEDAGKQAGGSFVFQFESTMAARSTAIENRLTGIFSNFDRGARGIVSNLADYITDEITRAFARSLIVKPLMGFLGLDNEGGGEKKPGLLKLFGFAHGGSFGVSGSGGVDSQLVAFRASPGEQVTVSPRSGSGAHGGGGVQIVQHFASGVTPQMMAFAMNQVRAETIAAVDMAFKRNPGYGSRI